MAHIPVLLQETIDALRVQPHGLYVDCTVGRAGHSAAIAAQLTAGGRLVCMDRDPDAIAAATHRFVDPSAGVRVDIVHAPFSELDRVLESLAIARGSVHGILADLGVSSPQLDRPERGFSFSSDGPLDMRMDTTSGSTAAELVASMPERDLADAIFQLGDERDSRRIARALVRARTEAPIDTTARLAEVVSGAKGGRRGARIHPATKTFQALRILVNDERGELSALLDSAMSWLQVGGRLALITFHSGEDRPVKRRLAELARGCVCPPSAPICICGVQPTVRLIHRKGVVAGPDELARNPRARTARLRIAERLEDVDEG